MHRRRRTLGWLLPALLLLGIGCERVGEAAEGWLEEMVKLTPIPEDRLAYVGSWEGDGMTLVIGAEGSLAYHRADDGGTRCFDDTRGDKAAKPDLEACVVHGDTLLAFGSGSTAARVEPGRVFKPR